MRRTLVTSLAVIALSALGAIAPSSFAAALVTPTSTITTIAGHGVAGFSGNGGPATQASLNQPRGSVATGPDGSRYIADTLNNRIRRIAPNGIISTFAGNGSGSFSGDGGPAVRAALHWPHSVAVDGAGNVYIADSANNRVRRVGTDGVIRTIVGTGRGGYNGDGIAATAATIDEPKSVIPTGSALYLADGGNNRIRRVDLSTRIITTIAGTGVAGYSGDGGSARQARLNDPHAMAISSAGALFVADTGNNRVRRIGANGVITTVAGNGVAGFGGDGGAATRARLNNPHGLALEGDGTVYVADTGNSRVRRVNLATGTIITVVGDGARRFAGDGGPAIQASLHNPRGVTVDRQGRLLIADTVNDRIRMVVP